MKRISEVAKEKIPIKPSPDQLQDWRSNEVTKYYLARLKTDFMQLHEEIANINFGDEYADLLELHKAQGQISLLERIIGEFEEYDDAES